MIPHWHNPRPRVSDEPEELIEPNEDERKNGWSAETLTAYVHERRRAQQASLDWKSRSPPLARTCKTAGSTLADE